MLFHPGFGAIDITNPNAPVVLPKAPSVFPGIPQPPQSWTAGIVMLPPGALVTSPINTSSGANNDYNDTTWYGSGTAPSGTPLTTQPGDSPVLPADPVFATPELAPPPSRIVAFSPVGLMAVGGLLVGLWAVFRK